MQARKSKKSAAWLARTLLFIGLVVLGAVAFSLAKETYKKQQVMKEINQLQEEAARIEKENSQIKDKIAYLESRDYREKEAKDKLNLQDPSEKLVIIKPSLATETESRAQESASISKENIPRLPNFRKWWNYFFQ
jgi:cell division protein FtsB